MNTFVNYSSIQEMEAFYLSIQCCEIIKLSMNLNQLLSNEFKFLLCVQHVFMILWTFHLHKTVFLVTLLSMNKWWKSPTASFLPVRWVIQQLKTKLLKTMISFFSYMRVCIVRSKYLRIFWKFISFESLLSYLDLTFGFSNWSLFHF